MNDTAKLEWMADELRSDDIHLTPLGIESILSGDTDRFEPEVVDYVLELESEWDNV